MQRFKKKKKIKEEKFSAHTTLVNGYTDKAGKRSFLYIVLHIQIVQTYLLFCTYSGVGTNSKEVITYLLWHLIFCSINKRL